jgi:hypothetical protein
MRTFFSTVVGGGVLGKGDGTARITTIQVGATIEDVHLFIEVYPQVGEMTTGKIVGEGMNGINKECPTNKFNRTGGTGKGISIGRKKITGVSKIRTERDHDNNSSMNKRETMKEEEIRKTGFLQQIFRMCKQKIKQEV